FIWVRTQMCSLAASVLICSINSRALLESPGRAVGSCKVMDFPPDRPARGAPNYGRAPWSVGLGRSHHEVYRPRSDCNGTKTRVPQRTSAVFADTGVVAVSWPSGNHRSPW